MLERKTWADTFAEHGGTMAAQSVGYLVLSLIVLWTGEPFGVAKLLAFALVAFAMSAVLWIAGLVAYAFSNRKDHP